MATTGEPAAKVLSEEEQETYRSSVPSVMLKTPFLAGLNLSFDAYEHDDITLRLTFREDLTNDGTVYHGGVVAAVMDTAGAAAAWSNHDFNKGMRASTVSMSVQYVGSCKKSDLVCRARAVKRGKELIFTEITARDAAGNVVAHAVQTYRIV
ncbi:MAG: PaaI family thioesterase [Actinobacteria bacterium]|nr:PaaI family thioesterase [Actinomycetota bacterium]